MTKRNENIVYQWLKGIGLFLLISIYLNMFVIKGFKRFGQTETHDTILYVIFTISIIIFPTLLGKFLDFISFLLINIFNNWKSKSSSSKTRDSFSLCLSIIINTIAIQKIFANGTTASFNIYLKPIQLRTVINYFINSNLVSIILFSLIITFVYYCYFLVDISSLLKKIFNEYFVLILVSILVSVTCWNLIDIDNSLYHLNVVLFSIVAFNTDSPSLPIVSEDFISLYGGYFIWIGILVKLFGNTLFSIKFVLTILTTLQVILYFIIVKALINHHLIRIMIFVSGVFWSYYYIRVITTDIYFQYFPLRTLFPSIFIISSFYLSNNTFFQINLFATKFFKISLYDILLDFLVAIAILNNLDSGASVLVMYLFLYSWNFIKSGNYKIQAIAKHLTGLIINLIICVVSFFLLFKLLSGELPNLKIYTAPITQYKIFGLPFPDDLWMIFIVFYSFTLIQAFTSSHEEDINARYRFSVAIYGLTSIFYFINRSHPWNLLLVSIPFFLCCGFFIEQSFNSFVFQELIDNYQAERNKRKIGFVNVNIIRLFISSFHDLIKLVFDGVFIMPIILISLIAILQFIPLTIHFSRYPKSYSEISNIEKLSNKIAILETNLNVQSIIISDSYESYYYLFNNRKILYYPEYASIFDASFKSRFVKAINTFNPIVLVCKIGNNHLKPDNFRDIYIQSLIENNYQYQKSEFECDIFTKN